MMSYAFVSAAMLKYDKNLSETRENLVPDEIDEDEFWCNYFYTIERIKAELGLPNILGDKIEEEDRIKLIEEEMRNLEES